MTRSCAAALLGLIFFGCGSNGGSVYTGGPDGGAGSLGSGGNVGSGGSGPVVPAVCTARTPAPSDFEPVVSSVPLAGLVEGTFTSYFTGDVAIAEGVLVVGVPGWLSMVETDHASTFVFRYDGQAFQFEQELLAPAPAAPDGHYGEPVEISESGQTIIVGDNRSAYIYRYTGSEWTGGEELAPRNEGDALASVSVTDERAAVGYYKNGDLPGSVYVYRFSGTAWELEQRIVDARLDSSSGTSVAIDGERLVIVDRQASAYAYSFDGAQWVETQTVSISSDVAMHGTRLVGHGSSQAVVFELDGDQWVRCESVGCNEQCDLSVFGRRIALGGAPTYTGTQNGSLVAYDGSDWVDIQPIEFEARNVDVGRVFAVFTSEGAAVDPVQVVQLEAWQ